MGIFDTLSSWIEEPFDWTAKEVGNFASWSISQLIKAAGLNQSDLKKVGTDVFQFVSKAIYGVTHLINTVVNEVHHTVTLLAHDVAVVAQTAGAAAKWVSNAEAWFKARISDVLKAFEHDVIQPIEHEISTVATSASNLVKSGLATITADITTLEHTVITPISTWISNAEHWFGTEFSKGWQAVENDVIGPIKDVTNWVEHTLPGIVSYVEKDVAAAVNTVEKAGDWLIKFAEHPITDIETMVREIFSADAIAKVEAGAELQIGKTDQLESFLGSLFGK